MGRGQAGPPVHRRLAAPGPRGGYRVRRVADGPMVRGPADSRGGRRGGGNRHGTGGLGGDGDGQ